MPYDYWKLVPTYYYSPVAERISRRQLLEISQFLHFTQNESNLVQRTNPSYDSLWKIRLVITTTSDRYLEVYNPDSASSIDDHLQGKILSQAISSQKTYKLRDKSIDESRCYEWLCFLISGEPRQSGRQVGNTVR